MSSKKLDMRMTLHMKRMVSFECLACGKDLGGPSMNDSLRISLCNDCRAIMFKKIRKYMFSRIERGRSHAK